MRDREAAAVELGEQRLHVADDGFAGGGITHMADRGMAGQALDDVALGEGVADQAEAALRVEAAAVIGDDAGGFLSAMLERMQSERGERGGVGMPEDSEHPAFLAQTVAHCVGIEIGGRFLRHAHQQALTLVARHCEDARVLSIS